MKKVLSIVLALALLCVTFAACAGNGTSSTSSASEESSAVSSESSAEASESSASSEESTSTEKTRSASLHRLLPTVGSQALHITLSSAAKS